MTIKKINATKNSNAGAIIVAPKRQLLVQKRHTTYRSLRSSVHLCISHSSPFYPTPKSYALQCFSFGQTPQKCPSFGYIYCTLHVIHVTCTHMTQHSKVHFDWFSRFFPPAHSRKSPYFTMRVKT